MMWFQGGRLNNNIGPNASSARQTMSTWMAQNKSRAGPHLSITSLLTHTAAVNHTAFLGPTDLICIKLLMQLFVMRGISCRLVSPHYAKAFNCNYSEWWLAGPARCSK